MTTKKRRRRAPLPPMLTIGDLETELRKYDRPLKLWISVPGAKRWRPVRGIATTWFAGPGRRGVHITLRAGSDKP